MIVPVDQSACGMGPSKSRKVLLHRFTPAAQCAFKWVLEHKCSILQVAATAVVYVHAPHHYFKLGIQMRVINYSDTKLTLIGNIPK